MGKPTDHSHSLIPNRRKESNKVELVVLRGVNTKVRVSNLRDPWLPKYCCSFYRSYLQSLWAVVAQSV